MLAKHGTGKRGDPFSAEYKAYLKHLKTKYGLRNDRYITVSQTVKNIIMAEYNYFCDGPEGYSESSCTGFYQDCAAQGYFKKIGSDVRVPITTWQIRWLPTHISVAPTGYSDLYD
tara:strand:+ start:126 stop:470 length:345 start_codon:yes stop_codon:yes gene_type:complete